MQPGDSTEDDDDEPSTETAGDPLRSCGWCKGPRDTTPTQNVVGSLPIARRPLANARFNEDATVGNIGFFFGNWGKRTQKAAGGVQRNIDAQLKKNPGQIIGLCECQQETEMILRGEGGLRTHLKDPAVAGKKARGKLQGQ